MSRARDRAEHAGHRYEDQEFFDDPAEPVASSTERKACTICGAEGHRASHCPWAPTEVHVHKPPPEPPAPDSIMGCEFDTNDSQLADLDA